MSKPTTIETEVARFRRDVDRMMRERVREAIEVILDEELTEALGCPRHDRTEKRLGYRNGSIGREVTMETGLQRLRVPRGRIDKGDGSTGWSFEAKSCHAMLVGPAASMKRSWASTWPVETAVGFAKRWPRCSVSRTCQRARSHGSSVD